MVELREAELLAHHMESALRAIRQGDVGLDGARLDTCSQVPTRSKP
jgi:hypothetical protein